MAQKERKRAFKNIFLAYIQILVKCFGLVSLYPGGRIVDYRHNPFEFLLRNLDQSVGAPGPEAFATPLDESPRAKHAAVRLKSPFSRFIPPFHAAGSPAFGP